ncbi:MAG TPA: glycosyltransferase family 1 protein, partial [Candidatus Gracilibacteria bacterium]|nr:glycosyltransferase family 1 protein [Candidatus Gracilibacteria bacterium]
ADHVFTVSEASRIEVAELCGIDAKKIIVTSNSVSPSFNKKFTDDERQVILQKFGIPSGQPFFLYVGGYDERKNVRLLVETFMKKIAPDHSVNLVLAGGKSVEHHVYASFDSLTKYKNVNTVRSRKGDLCFTGFVPEEELPALYQSCLAFVNVSRKEGFNICLLEAAVSGAPIVTSDLTVHREVIRDCAAYVAPDNAQELANTLNKIIADREFYDSLKTKISAFDSPFSWEKTAAVVSEIYRDKSGTLFSS